MHSIEVTEENFQTEVLEKSKSVPILVDFWAEWCQPCQLLKPVLEKLAAEYNGKFILAKVNADTNQTLAAQFGVRGIPNVKAVYGGKIVNEFTGVLPEPEIRKFLSLIIPNESEIKRQHAMTVMKSGDAETALKLLDEAITLDSENYKAQVDKAQICVEQNDITTAAEILKKIPLAVYESDPRIQEIKTKIDIASRSAGLADKKTLLENIKNNPSDLQSKLDLANVFIAEQDYSPALDLLFEIIQQDRQFGDDMARKTILEIFTLAGTQTDMVREARKKLSRLLN